MYADLFRAPIIFLLLSDPVRGPALLRVVIAILKENDYHDVGDGWGEFIPSQDADNESGLEQSYYNLLQDDGELVNHWFQQLGLKR